MKKILFYSGILAAAASLPLSAQDKQDVRTIRLVQDDAQTYIASKVYELRHTKATDVRPFVENVVKRYSSQSKVERVNYFAKGESYLVVSTGRDFLPYVDDLIGKIDRPGKKDEYGSVIEGTGISRIAYTPNYRAAEDIVKIINAAIRTSTGVAFLNADTNTIYWKDDDTNARAILAWVKKLDRPLPQVNLRINYYEVRESKLHDIGVDYLAWKNGPGMNIFDAAYNGGAIYSNESILQTVGGATQFADLAKNFSTSWGYGGFFTAPQFDMSFVRLLQQSGNANLVANTNITFVNTALYPDPLQNQYRTYSATLTPDYQNIKKNADDRTDVVTSDKADISVTINNPVICFGAGTGEIDALGNVPATEEFYAKNNGGVVFWYDVNQKTVAERNNRGDELGNSSSNSGNLTLGFKTEKLLSSWVKENDVEQTIGIPFLSQIPWLKYLFGTTTTIREKTYIIVTAEASLVHPELLPPTPVSREIIKEELN